MDVPRPVVSELDIRGIDERRRALPRGRLVRGYHVARVDAFLDRIVAALRSLVAENDGLRAGVAPEHLWHGGAGASHHPTAAEVEAEVFTLARPGYRMREVDELLDVAMDLLAQLEAENEALRSRSASG